MTEILQRLGMLFQAIFIITYLAHIALVVSKDGICTTEFTNTAPIVIRDGVLRELERSSFKEFAYMAGQYSVNVAPIVGGSPIGLQYVEGFLSSEDIDKMIEICDSCDGWTSSPSRDGDSAATVIASRTSYSCPLIWPLYYLPHVEKLRESGRLTSNVEEELNFSWGITQRIASLLEIDETFIEPLQLIRYTPGQFYRQHHDHGSYYNADTEQRPLTMLLFLSNVPESDGGGYTHFPFLDISVLPRKGDAIVWRNEDEDTGEVLKAAVAPRSDSEQGITKHACNVWITKDPIQKINSAAYRT